MSEGEIQVRFWKALIGDVSEDRGKDIHVSDLLYDCLRRAWYDKRIGDVISDSSGLLAVWIGKKLHEMALCEEHEVELVYEKDGIRVVGRMDELCKVDGEYIVIDKKTTRQIPNKPHEHHVKQVLFYSYMLWKTRGIKPGKVGILYIDVANLEIKPYIIVVNQLMLEQVGRELEEKARQLIEALKSDKPPARQMGWWCNYCSMFKRCMSE